MAFDVEKIRADFPVLSCEVYGRPLAYLDSGATAQKPRAVIDKVDWLHRRMNANVHRGLHYMSETCTDEYEAAREAVRRFIGAGSTREIVFTSGATGSINLVAYSFGGRFVREGDNVITTEMEHHSNIVPWQMLCERKGAELRVLPFDDAGALETGRLDELIDSRVRLLYAVDGNGKVLGVTSWLPTYRDGTIIGWTLDFMRHRTDSVNGIMEFLIARMAERLRDEGNVEFMSLSAAPLAGMGSNESEHEESEVLRHALQMVADIMEPAYGFHSLFRFKLKFHPDEEKVYICYPDAAKLPQISLAVAQAYVPSLTPAEAMRFVRTIAPRD